MKRMNEARLRVLILNGLVMPGSGHIYLRHYITGSAIAAVFTVSAVFFLANFFMGAFSFFNTGEDFLKADQFFHSLWGNVMFRYSLYTAFLFWIGALVDGYRLTRER